MSDNIIIKGLSRLAFQFNESEKFKSFLTAFLDEFQYLDDQNENLKALRTLDASQGVQLDGVGEIVGLERPYETIETAGLFGFSSDDTAKGFGDLNNPDLGGNFLDIRTSSQLIGDDLYRLLLKAKIIQNKIAMTVDETTELISFMLGGTAVRYFLPTNLEPRYDIARVLDPFEQNLFQNFPTILGIGSATFHSYDPESVFSFAEDTDGLGFGDLGDPNLGGNFSIII